MLRFKRVLITGGGGYVGARLVPRLLADGYDVTVLDLFLFGDAVLDDVKDDPRLRLVKGDIRDPGALAKALEGVDAVIHLACISNDPSFELNPELGKSINLDAFRPLVRAAKETGVGRFIYASSSSVYGIKDGIDVTESVSLNPLTDYSRFKAECETILESERAPGFVTVVLRPATVCGYSPRQRLDVIVNILTNHAVNTRKIKIFGGDQLRPNLHIDDMVDAYRTVLAAPDAQVDGQIWNVGDKNHSVRNLAEIVRNVVTEEGAGGGDIQLEQVPTDDKRSYHISSERFAADLGFRPQRSVERAVRELVHAFKSGKLPNALHDNRYYNIKVMQALDLR